jgi:pyrroline-5-carboxylate reductase
MPCLHERWDPPACTRPGPTFARPTLPSMNPSSHRLHRRRQHGQCADRRPGAQPAGPPPTSCVVEPFEPQREQACAAVRRRARPAAAEAAARCGHWWSGPSSRRVLPRRRSPAPAGIGAGAAAQRDGRHPQRRHRRRQRQRARRACDAQHAGADRPGIAGLFARPEVGADERAAVEALLQPTGQTLWVDRETTSTPSPRCPGSGPAYVFYFIEAMMQAASRDGAARPSRAAAWPRPPSPVPRRWPRPRRCSRPNCARKSPPREARRMPRSPRWTTAGVKAAFVEALHAARERAEAELGKGG